MKSRAAAVAMVEDDEQEEEAEELDDKDELPFVSPSLLLPRRHGSINEC